MDFETNLIQAALDAQEMSYSPYSKFRVGAAVLAETGEIFTGCNVESAAYPVSICAERTAIAKAVSEGVRKFKAIAVTGVGEDKNPQFCYPCGMCRQMLNEFFPKDAIVIAAISTAVYEKCTLGELLPRDFGPQNLM
jgi:cytidine deaminase